MFADFDSTSRNKSGMSKSHGSSAVGPDESQLINDICHIILKPQVETVAEESTPPAKRLRTSDVLDKTENKITTIPLHLEPKAMVPVQMLAQNQESEIAELKFCLDPFAKKQEIIDDQECKIKELEKSLVFLTSREKDFEDRIKSLEKENYSVNQLLQVSQESESLLKDELYILKKNAVEDDNKIKHLQSNEELLRKEMDIELSLLNEKKERLERKIEACEKAFAISQDEMKAEPAPNAEESIFVIMNRELSNIQNRCSELNECNLFLASKIATLMGNQENYKILCEKYSALEKKNEEYENEIYDLQDQLSQVELHAESWLEFFSEHEEFDSVDSLWEKYSICQEQLEALAENQKKSVEESNQLKLQIIKLKEELQLATENASSVSKLLSDVHNNLSSAEKLNVFAKKENELLKRQLDMNFSIAFSSKDQSQAVPQEVLTLLDQTKKLREALSNEFK